MGYIRSSVAFRGKVLWGIALAAVLIGALCVTVSDVFLPFAVALYAILFLFEDRTHRRAGYLVPTVVLLFGVLSDLMQSKNGGFSFIATALGAMILLLALIFSYCFVKQTPKREPVFLMTVLTTAFILLSFLQLAFSATGTTSLEAAVGFYRTFYEAQKQEFLASIQNILSSAGTQGGQLPLTQESAALFFDVVVRLSVAMVINVGFLLTGIAVKLSCVGLRIFALNKKSVTSWRFVPSSVFAYAYVVLAVSAAFTIASADVFAIVLQNMALIFMPMFVYIGAQQLIFMLKQKKQGRIFLIVFLVVFVLSAQLVAPIIMLSFYGVVATLAYHRMMKNRRYSPQDENDSGKDDPV